MNGSVRFFAATAVAVAGLATLKGLSAADQASVLLALESPAHAAGAPAAEPEPDEADGHHAPSEGEDAHPASEGVAGEPSQDAGACAAASYADRSGLSLHEIEVLRSLSQRRRALEAREEEIETRALLLDAAEARARERVGELRDLEGRIQGLLGQLDDQEEVEITRLVTMYERMKAADAAGILGVLEDDVRLAVAARMREQSLAAILAAMPQLQAAELTTMLARRHQSADVLAGELAGRMGEGASAPEAAGTR